MAVNFIIEGNWSTQRNPQITDTLYQIMYRERLPWARFEVTNTLYHIALFVIGTDYTGSCKSSNNTIMTTMASILIVKRALQHEILPYQGLVVGSLYYFLAKWIYQMDNRCLNT
jgi:hypothetical protein